MKKFTILKSKDKISLTNDDENPVIQQIDFKLYNSDFVIWIDVYFSSEEKIPAKDKFGVRTVLIKGNEVSIPDAKNKLDAPQGKIFFDLIQSLDPLPPEVFHLLNEHGLSFPEYRAETYDPMKFAEDDIDNAISEALKAGEMGLPEKIIELANYYREHQQINEWVTVLSAVPLNSPYIKHASQNLLEYYNVMDEFSGNDIPSLTLKFKAAYFAQLPEAELYLAQLAGEGLKKISIRSFDDNVDTLIDFALRLREKNQIIAQLQKANEKQLETKVKSTKKRASSIFEDSSDPKRPKTKPGSTSSDEESKEESKKLG